MPVRSGGFVRGGLRFDLVPGLVQPGSDLVPSLQLVRFTMVPAWFHLVPTWLHRSQGVVQHCNDHHDVDGLCRELPDRMQEWVARNGDHINE